MLSRKIAGRQNWGTTNVHDIFLSTCSSRCDFLSRSRTFVIAGHKTSSTSLSWLLYELAMHPEHQSIIHRELKGSNDYDSMPFLNATIKVSTANSIGCSYSPLVTGSSPSTPSCAFIDTYGSSWRCSTSLQREDACSTQGVDTCLFCTTGMTFPCHFNVNLMWAFSSLPSLWGDDAEEWNPALFLDKALPVSLGVYANLWVWSSWLCACFWGLFGEC